jgi:hypothetical protein
MLQFSHKTEGERKRDFEKALRRELRGLRDERAADAGTPPPVSLP